ncbi:MAG: WbqC family protein [Psychroserpens sp.]|nr:WbqC family protein [Psychroserpens sp.]
MKTLIHPTYFPNVAHFVAMLQGEKLIFEVCDNYQKQTYRNRCSIFSANGRLDLVVPVHYTQKDRQQYRDVKISNIDNWQDQHLKSLESAYSASPFYEFYIDDLLPLFENRQDYIMEFNLNCLQKLFECLELPLDYQVSDVFEKDPQNTTDARSLANCRKEIVQDFQSYDQVFDVKHSFISNLSILDLLFNEGPNAINYLNAQKLIL